MGSGGKPVITRIIAVLLRLMPVPALANFLSYSQWTAMPAEPRAAYIAGSFDALVSVVDSAAGIESRQHYTRCIENAKMSNRQLAENIMQFASTRPALQTGNVPTAMIGYLIEACGKPPQ